jgi:hypothetical protein
VVAIVLGIKLYIDNQKLQDSNEVLETEKVRLEGELNELIVEYDSLKTENDSINVMLEAEQQKIRRLLQIQASNTSKIRMYKKELETLRKIMRSYIVQIDSLNTRNKMLTEENIQVKEQLAAVETEREELTATKEKLTAKVKLAEKLNAKNINAEGLNKRSKEKSKINKIEKIRVCFTIRENAVSEAGTKTVYLRIIRPDEIVLSSPEAGLFTHQGQQMVYSAKRDLDYENQDIDMCIYWNAEEELVEGTYNVVLYAEGHEIGSTTFALQEGSSFF